MMLGENIFFINQNDNVVLYNNSNGKIAVIKGFSADRLTLEYKAGTLNSEIREFINNFSNSNEESFSISTDVSSINSI